MKERFLKELIKRELEFKLKLQEKLISLFEEIKTIDSYRNIVSLQTPHIVNEVKSFISKNEFLLLKEDYIDLRSLIILVSNLRTKDKTSRSEIEVTHVNEPYKKLSIELENSITYLNSLLTKE